MSREFDVLIVGAGAVGSAMAALLLARKQASPGRVAIIAERAGPTAGSAAGHADAGGGADDWDLRVFALSRASQRLLQSCGAWQLLPSERVFAYERMAVWDASGAPHGAGSLAFDCAEIGEPNLGFIVDGRALNEACRRAATVAGAVGIEASVRSVAMGAAFARIGLADGRELDGKLLIAADGAASKTRELLGIGTAGHAYHQDALVAHVRTAEPHRATAWQRFLPSGPLAFLPLPDGRSSIVWSVGRAEADRLRALDAAGFAAALCTASAAVLGDVELTTRVASYPLHLQYALDYARPRAVLLGDAAHTIHPLAGQGLNLGLLDCASLAEELGEAGDPDLLGDYRPLRRYERRRKSENLLAATALDGLERLFANPGSIAGPLRKYGLEAVGKLPFIKRRLAQRALGLVGDVPAFLRSEAAGSPTGDRAWPRR
ncbi:MAG: FAD-dependent monooxygenase [Steroidobacteraceae bacterium]|jgi:2-polyprenylphenol 6-hydroxylase